MSTRRKPIWWQLYALVPVLAGLFLLEQRAALPVGWHRGVQAGVVVVIYGLVWCWIRGNAYVLMTDPIAGQSMPRPRLVTGQFPILLPMNSQNDLYGSAVPIKTLLPQSVSIGAEQTPTPEVPGPSARTQQQPLPVPWRVARGRIEGRATRKHRDSEVSQDPAMRS